MMPPGCQIVAALCQQVARAAAGRSEREVVTLISPLMWNAFCRGVGLPEGTPPGEWEGPGKTARVFGSETHIVLKPGYWAASQLFIA